MEKHNLIGIYKAISKLICRLPNIEQKEFVKQLRFYLSHEAKNMFPDYSNSQLSQVTGISRGVLADNLESEIPDLIINKDSVILGELWRHKNKEGIVPVNGKNSFYSIAKSVLNGSYKPQSTLKALLATDSVELTDEGLLIKNYMLQPSYDDSRLCDLAEKVIGRYVDTLIYNFNNDNVDKNFDQTYSSTKISPGDAKLLQAEMKSYFRNEVWPKIKIMIDRYESDVSINTFPIYSVSIFEYLENKFSSLIR